MDTPLSDPIVLAGTLALPVPGEVIQRIGAKPLPPEPRLVPDTARVHHALAYDEKHRAFQVMTRSYDTVWIYRASPGVWIEVP